LFSVQKNYSAILSKNALPGGKRVSETQAHLLLCRAMDYLWTPWRYAYVTGAEKPTGCIFCDAPKLSNDQEAKIVHRGEHSYIILNAYPYTPGRWVADSNFVSVVGETRVLPETLEVTWEKIKTALRSS